MSLSLTGCFAPIFRPSEAVIHKPAKEQHPMIEKQFGTEYGPAFRPGDKAACIRNLQAEMQRHACPYGWLRVYETLLFGFYNPRSGQCFPSHQAIATKAGCSVSTVQRAMKWARDNSLIQWAHGLVRDGWRVLRTSNRYAFAAFLSIRRTVSLIAATAGQRARGIPTSYKSLAQIDAEARSFSLPTAPCLQAVRR